MKEYSGVVLRADFGSVEEPSRGSEWGIERGQRVWKGSRLSLTVGALFSLSLCLLLDLDDFPSCVSSRDHSYSAINRSTFIITFCF